MEPAEVPPQDPHQRLYQVKPRYRGVSHQAAFFVALGAGPVLLAVAPTRAVTYALVPYVLSLFALYGVSALYHRIDWSPAARMRMRNLDHATIFVFIAGSYTPFCLLALPGATGQRLLLYVWLAAVLGVLRDLSWPRAPKAVKALPYLLVGWLGVAYMPLIFGAIGTASAFALVLGGLLYSLGAVIYALHRPDPWPAVFGYHEVFHALVIAACICHFGAIAHLALLPR